MAQERPGKGIEGHYNYYGVPAYILRQRNNTYTCGFYDPAEGVFKASGSIQNILWDGVKIPLSEAKQLIAKYAATFPKKKNNGKTPDWIMTQDEASQFLQQAGETRTEGQQMLDDLLIGRKKQKRSK